MLYFKMRVPHTVSKHTLKTYSCSERTTELLGEVQRCIKAESSGLDEALVPLLKNLAVQVLVDTFCGRTPLDVLPRENFNLLVETLPETVPLETTVPLVPDGVYWRRCAHYHWKSMNVVSDYGDSWRRLVVERRLQQELEEAPPTMFDEALRIARLAGHLVRRVRLRRLLNMADPHGLEQDLPVVYRDIYMSEADLMNMELDIRNLFSHLVNLEELDVIFGLQDFENNLSEPSHPVKVSCCRALAQALPQSPAFRRLRVHRTQLQTEELCSLLEPLRAVSSLTELDLSNCYLGDGGAQVVAAFLLQQPALSALNIANNNFGARGATFLAQSLLQKTCAPLARLDVSLNSLGDVGGHNLAMALVPRDHRQPLRDPAEDEHVQAAMLAEEKERQKKAARAELSGEGDDPKNGAVGIFRGLVERAARAFAAGEQAARQAAAEQEPDTLDWDVEEQQERKQSAILADVVQVARLQQQEAAEAEEARSKEELERLEAAAREAERWEGAPERVCELRLDGCRLGATAGLALALLLQTNRTLSALTVSNNSLGAEAGKELSRALEGNPRVLRLDLRMTGARWEHQVAMESFLRRNNAALRAPLAIRDLLQEREKLHRARLETSIEVLGRQAQSELFAVNVPTGGSRSAGGSISTGSRLGDTSSSLSAYKVSQVSGQYTQTESSAQSGLSSGNASMGNIY